MTREKIELLQEELTGLQLAAGHLEYSNEKMSEIYEAVISLSPSLLVAVPKVIAYANNLTRRYPE